MYLALALSLTGRLLNRLIIIALKQYNTTQILSVLPSVLSVRWSIHKALFSRKKWNENLHLRLWVKLSRSGPLVAIRHLLILKKVLLFHNHTTHIQIHTKSQNRTSSAFSPFSAKNHHLPLTTGHPCWLLLVDTLVLCCDIICLHHLNPPFDLLRYLSVKLIYIYVVSEFIDDRRFKFWLSFFCWNLTISLFFFV